MYRVRCSQIVKKETPSWEKVQSRKTCVGTIQMISIVLFSSAYACDTCVLGSWNSPKYKADVYPKASQEEDWCFGALCSSNLLTKIDSLFLPT